MTNVHHAGHVNEATASPLWQGFLPASSTGKLAVVMRTGDCIDLLVLSDREKSARMIPKVGDHIADALDALNSFGLLPDTSAIIVIHHLAADTLVSSHEEKPGEFSADSNSVRSLPCHDLQRSVREDVAFLRVSPLILQHAEVRGLIYDVRNRQLSPVAVKSDSFL